MTILQELALIAHIFLGVAAVIFLYTVWLGLVHKQMRPAALRTRSMWAFVLTFLSWLTGAFYYVTYYGTAVKPVIKAGSYPWAHTIMTESKEHFFLFLPLLAFVLWMVVWAMGDRLQTEETLRRALAWVSAVTTCIGIAVTLFGVAISGAVR